MTPNFFVFGREVKEKKTNACIFVQVFGVVVGILAAVLLLVFRFRLFNIRRLARRRSSIADKTTSATALSAADGTANEGKKQRSFSWGRWRLRPERWRYSPSLQDNELSPTTIRSREHSHDEGAAEMTTSTQADVASGGIATTNAAAATAAGNGANDSSTANVDRHTSVRSIMTLPAYSSVARESEQSLGREGDRNGIDVVVEFPETGEELEARREEEMASLYQIRVARRAEIAVRDERRRQRREARARGDQRALADIRRRADEAPQGSESLSEALIVEHQAKDRERRIPSVQYADLGIARHDGSRLRANSSDSDHQPLLGSAAGMGADGRPPPRDRSSSGTASVSSFASDERSPRAGSFPASSTSAYRRSNLSVSESAAIPDLENIPLSATSTTASTSSSNRRQTLPSTVESDISQLNIPHPEPPQYDMLSSPEAAPPYESPVERSNEAESGVFRLPSLHRLPSIRMTDERTPRR